MASSDDLDKASQVSEDNLLDVARTLRSELAVLRTEVGVLTHRTKIGRWVVAAIATVVIVFGLGFGYLVHGVTDTANRNTDILSSQRQTSYANCTLRNEQSAASATTFTQIVGFIVQLDQAQQEDSQATPQARADEHQAIEEFLAKIAPDTQSPQPATCIAP